MMPTLARIALTLAGLVAVLHLSPDAIAAKCKGEFAAAITECACTVKNRLAEGWSERAVLSAYYAPSVYPGSSDVATVASVMAGEIDCGEVYFMYGAGDVRRLHLERFEPVLVVRDGNKEVRFYRRWFRRSKK